ncbi:distal tail protein Dit [Streptococcus pseudoporcinus]|uniref:distal tail protein Dit n=1 Tax=Streptococcus pseudoporcinus TaxID=361101 RepID=UPI001CC231C4
MTQWCTVARGFNLYDGADFDPKFEDYTYQDGAEFLYTTRKSKKISIPFYNKTGTFEEYDNLQRALNKKTKKELKFSSLPNRVFYAVPIGTLNYDELVKNHGKGTITFIVSDGLAHSKNVESFPFIKNSDGVLEAKIINKGTDSVPVNYRIKLAKESGYVAIASRYGGIQYGLRDEVDGVTENKSVVLNNSFSNWTDGTTFYQDTTKTPGTTMSYSSDNKGTLGILSGNFTNTSNSRIFGAIKELILPQTARDWRIWARARFETGVMGQTGLWTLAVIDTSNKSIAAMSIDKTDRAGNNAKINFIVGDRIVKTVNFVPSFTLKDNPYGQEGLSQNKNMFDIIKENEKITFFWYGTHYSYVEPAIKDNQAKLVQFFVGQLNGRNTSSQFVTHHYLMDFSFQKLNVPYWRDVANRYPANSELFIDSTGFINPKEKGRLYVNNMIAKDDEILGTEFFEVPPGETKVQLIVSSFAEVLEASAEIEEVYI